MSSVCIRYDQSSRHQLPAVDDQSSSSSSGRVTDWQNTGGSSTAALSRLVAHLNDMKDKLQNAYRGLDVAWRSTAAGQYTESVLPATCITMSFTM